MECIELICLKKDMSNESQDIFVVFFMHLSHVPSTEAIRCGYIASVEGSVHPNHKKAFCNKLLIALYI